MATTDSGTPSTHSQNTEHSHILSEEDSGTVSLKRALTDREGASGTNKLRFFWEMAEAGIQR